MNLSHNKNNVESISNSEYSVDYIRAADPEIAGYSSNADVQRIMEGHPIGTFYTYEWAGYNNQGVSIFMYTILKRVNVQAKRPQILKQTETVLLSVAHNLT